MHNHSHFHLIGYLILACTIISLECKKPVENKTKENSKIINVASTNNQPQVKSQSPPTPDIFKASLDGNIKDVLAAIKMSVPINKTDMNGRTPLMLAAFNGHFAIVDTLLKVGAKVNIQDAIGRTALIYASSGNFPATINLLLKHNADVNVVDTHEGWTALMFAAAEGHVENVRILLNNGADPTLKDTDGDDAVAFALQRGHEDLAAFIRNRKRSYK